MPRQKKTNCVRCIDCANERPNERDKAHDGTILTCRCRHLEFLQLRDYWHDCRNYKPKLTE